MLLQWAQVCIAGGCKHITSYAVSMLAISHDPVSAGDGWCLHSLVYNSIDAQAHRSVGLKNPDQPLRSSGGMSVSDW